MWDLIIPKEKRKYLIIETLFSTVKPVTISELATVTGASERSIKYDLKELTDVLSKIAGAIITSTDGVQLDLPDSIGLDYFQSLLYKQSPCFLFLEKIFFNENMGYDAMSVYLQISTTSLRRMVQKIKSALRTYGLELKTQPFRVIGHETLIRHFYTAYFEEKYTLNDWPFENVNRDFMEAVVLRGIQYFELPETNVEFLHYYFSLGVDLSRGLSGHPQQNIHSISDTFRDKQYQDFLTLMAVPIAKFHIPEQTSRIYFNELIDWGLYTSVPYLLERMEKNQVLQTEIKKIQDWIQLLAQLFDLPLANQEYLILQLNSMIDFFRLFPPGKVGRKYILFPTFKSRYNDIFKQMVPLFYEEAEKMLIEICRERGVTLLKDNCDYLMYILLSRWSDLNGALFNTFNSCRILVNSHQSLQHAKALANTLRKELSSSHTIEIFNGSRLSQENLQGYNFDLLIVTNTTDLTISQPILYMEECIINERIALLHRLIADIIERNKQVYMESVKRRLAVRL